MTIVTKSQLAAELGISPARISQYLRQGLPERGDGRLDREAALSWIAANVPGGDDPAKGAALAADKVRKLAQRRRHRTAEPLRVPPPEPWLVPLEDCERPFDTGALLIALWTVRQLRTLGALAGYECGLSKEAAESVGDRVALYYAEMASDFMHDQKLEPFASTPDAPVWTFESSLRINWELLAKNPEVKASREKWGSIPSL